MVRAAALLVAGVLVVGGCGSSHAVIPPATPAVSPTPAPPGWVPHTDGPQGYTVAVPDSWDFVVRDSPTFDADLQAVAPGLSTYLSQALAADAQVRFVAADRSDLTTGFVSNVHVIVSDLGPVANAPTLKDLADAKVRYLTKQQTIAQPDAAARTPAVTRAQDKLSGQPAVRLDYQLSEPATSRPRVRSYLAVVDRGGRRYEYELTMGAGPAVGNIELTFATMRALFSLFPPAPARPVPSSSTSPAATPVPSASDNNSP